MLESQKPPRIYCFQADYLASQQFNPQEIPAWLSLEVNWQGYRIHTLPWVADVARVLGLLAIEDTPQGWQDYLESLGLAKIRLMDSEEFFEDKSLSGCQKCPIIGNLVMILPVNLCPINYSSSV